MLSLVRSTNSLKQCPDLVGLLREDGGDQVLVRLEYSYLPCGFPLQSTEEGIISLIITETSLRRIDSLNNV